jgi:hypothetical protein
VAPATVTVVTPAGSSTPAEDWVTLQGQTGQAYAEHASWIRNGEHLLALLGKVISRARVTETRSTKRTELRRMVLRQAGDFVAVVDEDNQFQRLIDRKAFVDRLARDTADDGQ